MKTITLNDLQEAKIKSTLTAMVDAQRESIANNERIISLGNPKGDASWDAYIVRKKIEMAKTKERMELNESILKLLS